MSRIPTIPELKRYKSEIVIKEVEEDEGGSSSDSSSDDYPDDDVIRRLRHDYVTLTFLCIITSQSNHMLTNLKYWDQLIYTIKHKTVKRELLFRVTVLFTVHATHSEIRWVRIPFSAVDLRSLLLTEIVVNKYHRWSKIIYESHIRYNVCFTSIFIE